MNAPAHDPPRGIVVGARRRRQGLGEFVARRLDEAGASVVGVVGTKPDTVNQALAQLEDLSGRRRGFTDLETAIHQTRPDFVAICSPIPEHRSQLETVAALGCHCLCEKPLWWQPQGADAKVTAGLLQAFENQRLLLWTITQWPYILDGYFRLFPEARSTQIESLTMWLSPMTRGPEMVLDSAPHFLSMIQALMGPGGDWRAIAVEFDEALRRCELQARFGCPSQLIRSQLLLKTQERPPRDAGFGINGMLATRTIRLPEYQLSLEAQNRAVRLEDPLKFLVRDFVRALQHGETIAVDPLQESLDLLGPLMNAAQRAAGQPPPQQRK